MGGCAWVPLMFWKYAQIQKLWIIKDKQVAFWFFVIFKAKHLFWLVQDWPYCDPIRCPLPLRKTAQLLRVGGIFNSCLRFLLRGERRCHLVNQCNGGIPISAVFEGLWGSAPSTMCNQLISFCCSIWDYTCVWYGQVLPFYKKTLGELSEGSFKPINLCMPYSIEKLWILRGKKKI